jgi:hypothetical protein
VVVIFTGDVPSERAAIGRALAAEVGWRFEHAAKNDFHGIAAAALGRREPLIIAGPPLEPEERDAIRGKLRGIRFVQLHRGAVEHLSFPEMAIDSTQPVGGMIVALRNELGI